LDSCKYRAFLSYSHRDAQWANWLHKALESYRPPKQLIGTVTERGAVPKRLAPIFRDREELASATDLGTVINEALRQSACQIVICSPNSARSRWVNEEILAFKRLGREGRIFCLVVDGEPNASDDPARAQEECFPPALRYRLDGDGNLSNTRTEPIAADARPGKDGRSNAKLKLLAGVLGVGFDALRRREQQRRQRRLFVVASGAVAGMLVTSGLATAALIARATAQRQTAIAQREAETARQTTAFLVDLFRISDPSEARGNSLTAREVLDRGAARVQTQLTHQPAIQSTLLDTLGTVYMGLGLYAQAKPLLETAADKRRALGPAETPALAVSLSHVGDLLRQRAEYAEAERSYRQAIALQRALPADRRDDAALARSLFGLGYELDNQGNAGEAERDLREALALQTRLFPGANGDTARTLQTLAWTISERDLNEAVPVMQSALAMERTLLGAQPDPDYAAVLNDLGILLRNKGDYDQSERLLRESLAMLRRLLGDKHPEIAMALDNIGWVLLFKGDLEGASSSYRQALAMQRELLGNVHPAVADTLDSLAWVTEAQGDLHGALQFENESLHVYRTLFQGDNPDVAHIMNRLGYLLTEGGDYASAETALRDALSMRRRLFGQAHPEIASSLLHIAILQIAKHQYSEALDSARAARDMYASAFSATNWKTATAESVSGAALMGLGQYAEAEKALVQGSAVLKRDPGALPMYRNLVQHYLGELHRRWHSAGAPVVARTASGPLPVPTRPDAQTRR
jgi:tetratricopeptide (TPR) repeat protein